MGMAQIGHQRHALSPQMLPPIRTREERLGSKGVPKVDEPGPPSSGLVWETGGGKELYERLGDGIAMERSLAAGQEQMILCYCQLATLCQIVL